MEENPQLTPEQNISQETQPQETQPSAVSVSQETQTTTQEKGSRLLKILIYISAATLLLGIGALGLRFYQEKIAKKPAPLVMPTAPTATPTLFPPTLISTLAPIIPADWKTYMNEEYGYEIKYPSDWEKEGGYQEPLEVVFSKSEFFPPGSDIRATDAQLSILSKEVSPDFIDLWNSSLSSQSGTFLGIGGAVALQEEGDFPLGEMKVYSLVNGGTFHQIITRVWKEGIPSWKQEKDRRQFYKDLFSQILSTFKFLDQK